MTKEGGVSWKKRPMPLTLSHNCMFRKPAIDALDSAGVKWVDIVQSMNDETSLVYTAADLGVRAEMLCTSMRGISEIDHAEELPVLPEYCVAMYFSPSLSKDIAEEFRVIAKRVFSESQ